MRLDRKDMRKILDVLFKAYPEDVDFKELVRETGLDETALATNCFYLDEFALISVASDKGLDEARAESIYDTRITARGIDFILDDGGLSAILGVLTVKLHEDTIRALLLNGIEASPATEGEKSALREAIGKAPATSFNAVINSLVGLAMSKGSEAVQLLSRHFLAAM